MAADRLPIQRSGPRAHPPPRHPEGRWAACPQGVVRFLGLFRNVHEDFLDSWRTSNERGILRVSKHSGESGSGRGGYDRGRCCGVAALHSAVPLRQPGRAIHGFAPNANAEGTARVCNQSGSATSTDLKTGWQRTSTGTTGADRRERCRNRAVAVGLAASFPVAGTERGARLARIPPTPAIATHRPKVEIDLRPFAGGSRGVACEACRSIPTARPSRIPAGM